MRLTVATRSSTRPRSAHPGGEPHGELARALVGVELRPAPELASLVGIGLERSSPLLAEDPVARATGFPFGP